MGFITVFTLKTLVGLNEVVLKTVGPQNKYNEQSLMIILGFLDFVTTIEPFHNTHNNLNVKFPLF